MKADVSFTAGYTFQTDVKIISDERLDKLDLQEGFVSRKEEEGKERAIKQVIYLYSSLRALTFTCVSLFA